MKEQKTREKPRISINQLGEYLICTPIRRKTIIKEQKNPPDYKVIYYNDVTKAIIQYFCNTKHDSETILNTIKNLKEIQPENRQQKTKILNNIHALKKFIDSDFDYLFDKYNISKCDNNNYFIISDVQISIHPELVLINKLDGKVNGAIKLIINKSNEIDELANKYISTILHRWIQDNYSESNSYKDIYLLDVFHQNIINAPKYTKTLFKSIEAACVEIKIGWESA